MIKRIFKLPATAILAWCIGMGLAGTAACAKARGAETDIISSEAPEKALDVVAARKNAKNGEQISVVGRIGGRKNPWIKGAAAFSIADRSLKACNERDDDACKTPWDYCCESNVPKSSLLVMFVDESGKPIRRDARELLGVAELQTVVVTGTAKRDKTGNVTLLASKVYLPETQQTK